MDAVVRRVVFGVFVVFSLLSLYFLFHIVFWIWSVKNAADSINEYKGIGEKGEVVRFTQDELLDRDLDRKFNFLEVDFTELKKRNSDIKAWLKIDAIGLDMPIVQGMDNEFYLTHDVDKKLSKLGWVFADVRSNLDFLGVNTVLYGHNAANQQMFGGLKKLLSLKETDNRFILFTTERKKMVFEIFSIYVTNYEDWKYVRQVFTSDDEIKEFIDNMRDRNMVKSLQVVGNISHQDKLLTFSTCYGPAGTTKRLVVHSRLIAEK